MFGTDEFKHMDRKQLRAKYAQVRLAVLATEYGRKFQSAEDFDSFVASFAVGTGMRLERSKLQSAFGQLANALTKTHIQITDETLRWGGFLGGDVIHDQREAEATCLALLQQPVGP